MEAYNIQIQGNYEIWSSIIMKILNIVSLFFKAVNKYLSSVRYYSADMINLTWILHFVHQSKEVVHYHIFVCVYNINTYILYASTSHAFDNYIFVYYSYKYRCIKSIWLVMFGYVYGWCFWVLFCLFAGFFVCFLFGLCVCVCIVFCVPLVFWGKWFVLFGFWGGWREGF